MRLVKEKSPLLSDFMTPDEAAKELGIHVKTLARWRDRGEGPPFHRLGRRILYQRTVLERWIRGRK